MKAARGAIAKIKTQMVQKLVEKLQCPLLFSSYGQIVEWLEQEFNVQVKYKRVYRLVRYQLKAKLKVPRPVSKDQDEFAVNLFKKTFPSP